MPENIYNYMFLINSFKESIGLEKAEAIVSDVLLKTNLANKKNNLQEEDILKICEYLKDTETGVIRVVASCLIIRINLSQMQLDH